MLVTDNISCGYGGEMVVRDVSFSVPEGGRLVILGPNGCGKTTLLRALMGILPHSGSVSVDGQGTERLSARERGRLMALMPQMGEISFTYTVMETVLMGRYVHMERNLFASHSARDIQAAEEQLHALGLWDERDRPITKLSGGQLQRVLLARTFAQEPKVILLDEPTNHLDLRYQTELVEELRRWTSMPGRAAVGVFHDLDLALAFADTVLLMDGGRSVYFGPAEGLDLKKLSRVFGMDVPGYMRASRERWERLEEGNGNI